MTAIAEHNIQRLVSDTHGLIAVQCTQSTDHAYQGVYAEMSSCSVHRVVLNEGSMLSVSYYLDKCACLMHTASCI